MSVSVHYRRCSPRSDILVHSPMAHMLGGVPKAARDDVGALASGMALDSDTRRKAGRDPANGNSNSKAE